MVKEALKNLALIRNQSCAPRICLPWEWCSGCSIENWIIQKFFDKKFAGRPEIAQANKIALRAGFYYAETIEASFQ